MHEMDGGLCLLWWHVWSGHTFISWSACSETSRSSVAESSLDWKADTRPVFHTDLNLEKVSLSDSRYKSLKQKATTVQPFYFQISLFFFKFPLAFWLLGDLTRLPKEVVLLASPSPQSNLASVDCLWCWCWSKLCRQDSFTLFVSARRPCGEW